MAKLISFSGSRILLVSDTSNCSLKDKNNIVLDESFDHISDEDILSNYIVWNGRVFNKKDKLPPHELKVALVSNYRSQCGISTYSEKLYDRILPYIGDYRIFAEEEEGAAEEDKVVRCWKRGKSTERLIQNIHDFKPDVILIQHEYGLWADAKIWLSLLTQLNAYKTFVVHHSVYRNHDDKTVCEMAVPNIIVHTDIAYNCLKDKGLCSNIVKIPHGCDDVLTVPRPWNMYRSQHTFAQFGFGFRYKGWENSIRAVAELKKEYPDAFFTGVFSESPQNLDLHQNYFEELVKLIDELDIKENVGLIRGFQSDDLLTKVLLMNRAALFPYIDNGVHTVLGCSGAARVAMTAKVPTIVTGVPLFDDLEGVCPRCHTMEDIVTNLKKFWSDNDAYHKQVEVQNEFLVKNSWDNVAKQFVSVFCDI